MPTLRRTALTLQSAYYLTTGAWPLAHRPSFERVTGPKFDWWLVEMVGALAFANGAALAAGVKRAGPETVALSLLSAAAFAGIDIAYVYRRRISAIYLGDAAVELLIAAAVLFG